MSDKEKYIPFRNYVINPKNATRPYLTTRDEKSVLRKKALDKFEEILLERELKQNESDYD